MLKNFDCVVVVAAADVVEFFCVVVTVLPADAVNAYWWW